MQDEPAALRAIANLQRLTETFSERRRQLAGQAGLTENQWRLLEEVAGEDFLPSMFARQREVSAAAVSRTLRQLLERKLVTAELGAQDGRHRVYRLTADGRRSLERVHDARTRAVEAIWSHFSDRKLAAFSRFAAELAERMEDYADPHGSQRTKRQPSI